MATDARHEHADASFKALQFLRTMMRLGPQLLDHGFWRELNPALAVTDTPFARALEPLPSAWAADPVCQQRLCEEGYLLSPEPLISADEASQLADGVNRIVAAGLPSGCALAYDEIYRLFARVARALEPILGPQPHLMLDEGWVYFVPPGDGARSHWTAFPPHRDWVRADDELLAGRLPSMLTGWVALTEASANDSCLYVVPGDADEGFRGTDRFVRREQFRLQDVRAVPALPGQLVLLTSHVAHWGSRSSAWSRHARISASFIFQRSDLSPRLSTPANLAAPLTLSERMLWAVRTLRLVTGEDQVNALMQRLGFTTSPGLSGPPSPGP